MDFLNSDHLRVVTPVTTNGVQPKLDDRGTQVYKETLLPLSAKKALMEQNNNLPNHLKKTIELVSNEAAPAPTDITPSSRDNG
jgi:hypothetical protein